MCATAVGGEITPEKLWSHEHVLEALMRDRDLLPVRYGTCVSDEADAVRALEDRHERLAEALEFVRGAVELAVRAVVAGEQPERPSRTTAATTGTEYMRVREREVSARSHAADAVHEPLARAARADVVMRTSLPGEVLRAAYLVSRDKVEAFVELVAQCDSAHPELTISCTGPWPPYSFSER